MTKRNPVTTVKNKFFDAQKVDNINLSTEQNYNETVNSAIINNHIGSGVVAETLNQNIIFDSTKFIGFLDGIAIIPQNQPSDNNFGNQLEILLNESQVCGKRRIKVAIIGLDFQNNLQFETFVFSTNETQVGKKHFTKVLVLLFNDFVGNDNFSMNLGGVLLIKEAKPMFLSRDTIVVSQNLEPNLFFRDFFIENPLTLHSLLQNALPTYNIDTLGIFTEVKDNKILSKDDVITQYGQKFLLPIENIQKISLLLSVYNNDDPNDLVWNGDLVVSVYKLQTTTLNPLDIVPETLIDFSPDPTPLAQISFNYSTLMDAGVILDTVPQPVDFVFSNTPLATGNILNNNEYYAFTLKRSGSANKCDILIATGNNLIQNSRITTFSGSVWVDIPEDSLWFEIHSDSAKVTNGQAYDSGNGLIIEKIQIDNNSNSTIDYCFDKIEFYGNDVFKAVLSGQLVTSDPVPSEITGNPIDTIQKYVPKVELLNSIETVNLTNSSEPILLGSIVDRNKKYYDSISSIINSNLHSYTIAENTLLIRIVYDETDINRYDTLVNDLSTYLLNGELVHAKITPNSSSPSIYYRIASAQICSMILGDVDGNGVVNENDVKLIQKLYGENLNTSPPLTTNIITDGYQTTYTNGYQVLSKPFSNLFGVSFQLIDSSDPLIFAPVIASGTDGILIADPNNNELANFTSASVNFSSIPSISNYKLVLLDNLSLENYGVFDISSININTDVLTIRKQLINVNHVEEILRADIDGDFFISSNDGYLLNEYVKNNTESPTSNSTYPAPTTNPYTKIGSQFNVIKLVLEQYNDRNDDYTNLNSGRGINIHSKQDLFLLDSGLQNRDFLTNPSEIIIEKKLHWNESLVVYNSKPQLLPSIFTKFSNHIENPKEIDGIKCTIYPIAPNFEKNNLDYYIPDNLIIGSGGGFKNEDGTDYKVDFEVASIVLEIPDGLFGTERTINILQDFIADHNGKGITRLGYPALRFSDYSFVNYDAIKNDQLRFSVAVQSFSPNLDGMSLDGYEGVIVDNKLGVHVDYENGLVTINFTNLYEDEFLPTLSTKIQIMVYLKKAGFNNKPKFIDSDKVSNLLGLISVFSGANVGGVSALVDLENDTTGILPVINGGTGLNSVGPIGSVLASNGTGLSYQLISALNIDSIFTTSGPSDGYKLVATNSDGYLDSKFYYKNPVEITIVTAANTTSSDSYADLAWFYFDPSQYIKKNVKSIQLCIIGNNTGPTGTAGLAQLRYSDNTYLNLSVGNTQMSFTNSLTNNNIGVFFSIDIKNQLSSNPDYLILSYRKGTSKTSSTLRYAKLIITYDNVPNGSDFSNIMIFN